jgi:hypothetical protein
MNKFFLLFLYIASFSLQYLFPQLFLFNMEFLNSLISVLSIFFGFYIVGLSIFVVSKFVNTLYLKEVKDSKGFKTTNLHILLNFYKNGLVLNLLSIFYFLLLIFVISNKNLISFSFYFSYLTIPLMFQNFLYSYKSLNQLIKIVKYAFFAYCFFRQLLYRAIFS